MMCVNVVKSQAIFKYHFRSRFDQVEGDIKDTVYQLRGLPLRTQMRFRFFDQNDRKPGHLVAFIVILTHIMNILNLF